VISYRPFKRGNNVNVARPTFAIATKDSHRVQQCLLCDTRIPTANDGRNMRSVLYKISWIINISILTVA
jgi:hypothetical protein